MKFVNQTDLIKECNKLMFSREHWWILPGCFMLGFSLPTLIAFNIWAMLVCGILSYPFAIVLAISDLKVKYNQKMMHDVIKEHVEEEK